MEVDVVGGVFVVVCKSSMVVVLPSAAFAVPVSSCGVVVVEVVPLTRQYFFNFDVF